MKVSPQSVLSAAPDQMASEIVGETVILGLTAGRYYGLDPIGSRVWQLIQTPTSFAEVSRTIVAEYDVEAARCEADLLALLQKMADAGLVEVRSE